MNNIYIYISILLWYEVILEKNILEKILNFIRILRSLNNWKRSSLLICIYSDGWLF